MSEKTTKKRILSKDWVVDYYGFNDKVFYRSVFQICIPLAIQQAINLFIQFVDNVMVGALGDEAVAAVTLAGQVPFFMMILSMGACAAGTSFASQQWGRGEQDQIRKTTGLTLICAFVIAGFFLAISQLFPTGVLRIFSSDAAVIREGVSYLRIVTWGFPFQAVTFSLGAILRSMEEVKIPTYGTLAGVVTNCVFNYLLIFGKFGFPRWGVAGAAVATVIAHIVNAAVIVLLTYKKRLPIVTNKTPMFRDMRGFPQRFFRVAFPVMGNEGLWAIAQIALTFIYAKLGTQMTAAMGVFGVLERISLVFFMAMANGCVVIAGKEVGQGNFDTAYTYCMRLRRLVLIMGVFMAILINLLGPVLLQFYNVSDYVKYIVRCNLFILLFKLSIDAHNFMIVVGILRAGGDTRYAFIIDSGAQLLLMVPIMAFAAFVLHVPLHWMFAFTIPAEVIKFFIGRHRFLSKKWMNVLH
ncbi:MATE family efflux transporter [Eubacteriales bacterium OttesenSCG-928-M02]|nr:MATE family efflux transporter [Eubacteriales bacterium OttesenSCG-928-M02]